MSFENIMGMFDNKCHFVVINRAERPLEPEHGEIGFCTMAKDPDYFLWINIVIKDLKLLIDKYNLTVFG